MEETEKEKITEKERNRILNLFFFLNQGCIKLIKVEKEIKLFWTLCIEKTDYNKYKLINYGYVALNLSKTLTNLPTSNFLTAV